MSIFFDETYYLQQNPDVLQAIVSGALTSPISGVSAARYHFDTWGWKELRDPNASFDTSFYLEENLDVLAAGVNPLDHFINYGSKEGRVPNATLDAALGNPAAGAGDDAFDATTYLAANADVKAAVDAGSLTAYQHWVLYGQFEGRAGAQTTGGADLSNAGAGVGSSFTLTTGVDSITGTAGNDTFTAADTTAATWTTGDSLNGGGGTDTLKVITAGNITTAPTGATLTSIEVLDVTSGGTVAINTTGFSSLTSVKSVGVAGANITAAATTDVSVTDGSVSTTTDGGITITGGKNVTAALTAANDTTDVDANAEVVVNGAAGAVNVSLTGKYADGANNTMSNIAVTGGSTVSVTTKAGLTAAQIASQTTDTTNFTITQSAVAVTGTSATTAVTVTQDAAVTEVDSATAGKIGIANGAVTVTDANAASTTAAGTINTVTLNNFGAATVNSGALTTLNLSGTGTSVNAGTLGALTTAANTALAINTNGLTTTGAVTIDNDITTLNIASSTAASTIASLVAGGAKSVNVSGDAALTVSANTLGALTDVTVTNTAGFKLEGTAIGTGVTFTGGAGADAVTVSDAWTKAVSMGAGDDTVTFSGNTLATGGSVSGGEGVDTLVLAAADAIVFDNDAKFNTAVTGFEKLKLGASGANTINLAGINGVNYVSTSGATGALVLDGFTSGGTLQLTADVAGGSYQANVNNAAFNAADVFNIDLSKTGGVLAAGSVTVSGVETVNITANDAATAGSAAVIHTLTLVDANATTVNVSGNNGLTLTNDAGNTAITSFDASGVVANGTADTVDSLAVTFVSNNSTASATVSITGGAGNDTLTGNAAKDTINGGAGSDIVKGALGQDNITVGAGHDVILFDSFDGVSSDSTTAAADVVNGFKMAEAITTAADLNTDAKWVASTAGGANASVLGIDMDQDGANTDQAITVEANVTDAVGQAAGVTVTVKDGIMTLGGAGASTVDTLGEWLTEASAIASTDGDILAFEFGGNTYVFGQNGTADLLVNLAGVTGAAALVETTGTTTGVANTIYYTDIA